MYIFTHNIITHVPLDARHLIHCCEGYFGLLTLKFLLFSSLVEGSYVIYH